jgi:hypothetical protein
MTVTVGMIAAEVIENTTGRPHRGNPRYRSGPDDPAAHPSRAVRLGELDEARAVSPRGDGDPEPPGHPEHLRTGHDMVTGRLAADQDDPVAPGVGPTPGVVAVGAERLEPGVPSRSVVSQPVSGCASGHPFLALGKQPPGSHGKAEASVEALGSRVVMVTAAVRLRSGSGGQRP